MVSSVSACQASIPSQRQSDVARKLDACGAKLREWKSVAVSGIALCSSKNAVSFSSACTTKRFPSSAMRVSNETSRHHCRASSKCCSPTGTQHYEKQTYCPIRFLSSTRLHRTSCLRSSRLFNAKRSATGFPPPRSVDQSF